MTAQRILRARLEAPRPVLNQKRCRLLALIDHGLAGEPRAAVVTDDHAYSVQPHVWRSYKRGPMQSLGRPVKR